MNKLMTLIVMVALALASGCGTLGNGRLDNPLLATPYQAGRTFVFVDVVTEPVQPAEVQAVVNQVYSLAQRNLGVDMLDNIVLAQIQAAYPDATPEFHQVVLNLYQALTARITEQLRINTDLPERQVLDDFNRGIRDALKLYKPGALD